MIKEIEMIKMRKDIDHLIKNYFFSRVSLAKALDILPKVLRDFTVLKVVPQDANFYKMHNKIKAIKEQIQEAEDYNPIAQIKMTNSKYGNLVRKYRKNNLLNQQEFASLCGISFRTVQNIEDGMPLRNQTKKKLNNILNVNLK